MRAVVVAGRKPLYEMGAADLVVRGLDELSFINLKQLFSNEEGVEGNVSPLPFGLSFDVWCMQIVWTHVVFAEQREPLASAL